MAKWNFVFAICIAGLIACVSEIKSTKLTPLTITSGTINGIHGAGVFRFLGIPYALAPQGNRRWQPPTAFPSWAGTKDATAFGKACPQLPDPPRESGLQFPRFEQSEDCLNLNVWTPDLTGKAPVLVWIHGGSFIRGAGSAPIFEGSELARRGQVIVSLNYRLGIFGFLAHPDLSRESEHGASGNYGLMDQIEALRWIHKNIKNFGGDPERITLFGQSAGAISICDLLASPQAAGLFHGAIMQSGTCTATSLTRAQTEAEGARLASRLSCRGPNALPCLRQLPVETLVGAVPASRSNPVLFPSIDGWILPDHPLKLLEKDSGLRPVLIGTNSNEAGSQRDRELLFDCPALKVAQTLRARGAQVFFYRFNFPPAYHGSEIPFVFGTGEPAVTKTFTDLWSRFAGDVRSKKIALKGWPTFDQDTESILEIDAHPRVKTNMARELCHLGKNL